MYANSACILTGVSMPRLLRLDYSKDFRETWYERNVVGRGPIATDFNFLQLLITIWLIHKLKLGIALDTQLLPCIVSLVCLERYVDREWRTLSRTKIYKKEGQ